MSPPQTPASASDLGMQELHRAVHAVPIPEADPIRRWRRAREASDTALEAVVRASRGATTVGQLFFAGYQGALEQLLGTRAVQALLVTEGPNTHPRSIRTTCSDGRVRGTKGFGIDGVDTQWVLARRGDSTDGQVDLVLARVGAEGDRSPIPLKWLRDVPHSSVRFDTEAVEIIEDAWIRVVKPFRFHEDLGVLTALSAARMSEAGDEDACDRFLSILVAAVGLWECAPSPLTIRALSGLRRALLESEPPGGALSRSWSEDRRLFEIASGPRNALLARAREALALRS